MNLLLIPTAFERDRLVAAIHARGAGGDDWLSARQVGVCGFGMAAAAAISMRQLIQHRPEHVILAGIAGSFGSTCEVGRAYWFSGVRCDGIGVGCEDTFLSADALGWNHVDTDADGQPIRDRIELELPERVAVDSRSSGRLLVTACAGSADAAMAESRRRRAAVEGVDAVAAEDMEGFAVAIACRLMGVRLSIVRGISNRAGDRDHATWKVDEALGAVADLLLDSAFLARIES